MFLGKNNRIKSRSKYKFFVLWETILSNKLWQYLINKNNLLKNVLHDTYDEKINNLKPFEVKIFDVE